MRLMLLVLALLTGCSAFQAGSFVGGGIKGLFQEQSSTLDYHLGNYSWNPYEEGVNDGEEERED